MKKAKLGDYDYTGIGVIKLNRREDWKTPENAAKSLYKRPCVRHKDKRDKNKYPRNDLLY